MNSRSVYWLVARAALVTSPFLGLLRKDAMRIDPGWGASLLAPLVLASMIFLWLQLTDQRKGVDVSSPYSLTLPFFPMFKHPLRFWFLCALVCFSFTAVGILKLLGGQVELAEPAFFLSLGLGMLAGVVGWVYFRRRTTQP